MPEKRVGVSLDRIILHFDYDCFYASCFERENPALKQVPLGVQQKNIIATCNYAARERGLRKLMTVRDAKKSCPDLVLVNGEDLTRFRDVSKDLFQSLTKYSWSGQAERLGLDEVWLDVTDAIAFNVETLNPNQLDQSFFCLCNQDPTVGFSFDASGPAGSVYPATAVIDVASTVAAQRNGASEPADEARLLIRLVLASHLAAHLRTILEHEKGFTCSVGVSTSKLLSKLVGSQNKPRGQTTLLPPYTAIDESQNQVIRLLDEHEVGKVPGIGFTLARKLRTIHQTLTGQEGEDVDAASAVSVQQVRRDHRITAAFLERILGGPGAPYGIGGKVYALLRGHDPTPVANARDLPRQISIEDTYARLDAFQDVRRELLKISNSLIKRMHADLLTDEGGSAAPPGNESTEGQMGKTSSNRWLARPRTLRLSSRVRPPPNSTVEQTYHRSSRSAPLPPWIFSLAERSEALAERLVLEGLTPLFRRLHPERSGWGICLLNIAVTNMVETGAAERGSGRDIADMFRNQGEVMKKPTNHAAESETWDGAAEQPHTPQAATSSDHSASQHPPSGVEPRPFLQGSEDLVVLQSQSQSQRDMDATMDAMMETGWDGAAEELGYRCPLCDAQMPPFAATAHARFHELED